MSVMKRAASDFRKSVILMTVFSFFSNILLLVVPLYMLQIYDRVLPSKSSNTLIFLSMIAVAALVVLGIIESVKQVLSNRIAARLDTSLSDSVLKSVIAEGHATNGNTQPMRDLQAVRGLLASRTVFGLLDFPFAGIFIAVLYLIHPTLFWLTLGGAGVLVIVALINQAMLSPCNKAATEKTIRAASQAEHFARNADSIVAMGMISNVLNSWGKVNADAMIQSDRAARINAFFSGLSRLLRLILQVGILGVGAILVLDGQMTAGMIFASSLMSGRALQPIDMAIGSWRNLSSGYGSWKRLKLFMQKHQETSAATQLPDPAGRVEAVDLLQPNPVDRNKPPVLGRVSFRVEPGECVVVLGASGSGKSTLARIMVGAMKPFAGEVRIDGHDIKTWDREHLGRFIGYLAQDVELLPGTVAQNIARFDPDANDEDIITAARFAHAEDLIQQFPKGFDTMLGPEGIQISGGEKQRVALARAFFGLPKILVLDEPNSSLDRIGEAALMRALTAAKNNNMTVIVVSQREMVLGAADKILRMNKGQVTDFGPRDAIIAKYSSGGKTEHTSKPAA